MKLLHIDSSPKGELSNSRYLSRYFVESLTENNSLINVEYLDLAETALPHIDGEFASATYTPIEQRTEDMQLRLQKSDALCLQILSADLVVLGIPMHNWCYPSAFKAYIDHITRGGLTYEYDAQGNLFGKLGDKKFLFITTRGVDLSIGNPYAHMDALTPALTAAFSFIGATDMTFVDAQPLQFANQEAHQAALESAKNKLNSIAKDWL